jgi:hypothetical protein
LAKPVMFPARLVEPRDDADSDWIAHVRKHDRDRPRLPLEGNGRLQSDCQNNVGLRADQLLRERLYPIGVTAAPPRVHSHVAATGPAQVRKRLRERRVDELPPWIVFVERHEHADAPGAAQSLTRFD